MTRIGIGVIPIRVVFEFFLSWLKFTDTQLIYINGFPELELIFRPHKYIFIFYLFIPKNILTD